MFALKNGLFDQSQVTYCLEPGSRMITLLECVDIFEPRTFDMRLQNKFKKGHGIGDGRALRGKGRVYTCERDFVELVGSLGYENWVWMPRKVVAEQGLIDFCEVIYAREEGMREVILQVFVMLEAEEEGKGA